MSIRMFWNRKRKIEFLAVSIVVNKDGTVLVTPGPATELQARVLRPGDKWDLTLSVEPLKYSDLH